jgi:hypothetical protein
MTMVERNISFSFSWLILLAEQNVETSEMKKIHAKKTSAKIKVWQKFIP